jgi:intracellular septation protein A
MKAITGFLRFVIADFGPLIVFWTADWLFGLRAAIGATVVFALLDALYRIWRRLPVTRIYVLSTTLAIVFGAIDLMAASPFMLRYEAVITNLAFGAFFVAGSRGEKSLIQELAEKRRAEPIPNRPDVRRFFQLFTLFWAGYFFLKAAVYLWLGEILPLEQAMALRGIIGGVSLAAMIALSFQGQRLFFFCRWLGILPRVEGDVAAPPSAADARAAGPSAASVPIWIALACTALLSPAEPARAADASWPAASCERADPQALGWSAAKLAEARVSGRQFTQLVHLLSAAVTP